MSSQIGKILLKAVIGLSIFTVIIVLIPLVRGLFVHDARTVNDSALSLGKVSVSESENAYFDLVKAEKLFKESSMNGEQISSMLAGETSWDDQKAREWVSMNQGALAQFKVVANKKAFQDPAAADPALIGPETLLPNYGVWRRLAQVSTMQALVLMHEGKNKAAMDSAFDVVHVAELMERSQMSLLGYLAALGMKKNGLTALRQILDTNTLSTEERLYLYPITEIQSDGEDAARILKVEYIAVSGGLKMVQEGKLFLNDISSLSDTPEKPPFWTRIFILPFYFQLNKTQQLIADDFSAGIKIVEAPCEGPTAVDWDDSDFESPIIHAIKFYFTPNATGKEIHKGFGFDPEIFFAAMKDKRCEVNALIESL